MEESMELEIKEKFDRMETLFKELHGEMDLGFMVIETQFKDYLGFLANMIERERVMGKV